MSFKSLSPIACAALLSGCGLVTPDMQFGDTDGSRTADFVSSVTGYIRCELAYAAYDQYFGIKTNEVLATQREVDHPQTPWLIDWAADVTLTLKVQEKSVLAPSVKFPQVLEPVEQHRVDVARSKALSLGLSATADATRELTLQYFLDFVDLLQFAHDRKSAHPELGCKNTGKMPIIGSLKLDDSLFAGVRFASEDNSLASRFSNYGGPIKVLKHNVTFITDISGSINPTITLSQVAANTTGNLYTANRMKTNSLIVAMGPVEGDAKAKLVGKKFVLTRPREPSEPVRSSSFSSQIGNSIDR